MDTLNSSKYKSIFVCLITVVIFGILFMDSWSPKRTGPSLQQVNYLQTLLVKQLKESSNIIEHQTNLLNKLEMNLNSKKKYLIYKCVGGIGAVHCSGWGNRLIGIVATYILAGATDRTFGIMMTNPCDLRNYLIPNSYNWDIPNSELQNLSSIFIDVRNNAEYTKSLIMMDFNKQYQQDVVYISANQEYIFQLRANFLYKDKVPKWEKAIMYKNVFEHLFKLNETVNQKLKNFTKMAKPTKNHTLACAQIRMGKSKTIPWDNQVMNKIKDTEVIWDYFNKTAVNSTVFVTTDSQDVRNLAKRFYSKRFIDTDGPIIHMDKPYRSLICEGMEKLILDQFILMSCDHLLVSSSSFSRIPAYIHGNDKRFLFLGGKLKKW